MNPEQQFARLRDPENWTEIPTEVGEGIRPRRAVLTPWTAVPAAAVIVIATVGLALAVGGHEPAPSHHAPAVAAVPWKAIPAHDGAITLLAQSSAPDACAAQNLQVKMEVGGGAGGTFYSPFTVTNSGGACILEDNKLKVAWGSRTAVSDSTTARVLPTGATQRYQIAVTNCPMADTNRPFAATVSLDGAPVTNASLPASDPQLDCPGDARLVPVEPASADELQQGANSALSVTVNVPDPVSPGPLDYTVTLTNKGAKPFKFGTCPTYTEIAAVGKIHVDETYTLNCTGVGTIAPGASRTFAMKMTVPSATGLAKFGWLMDNGPVGGKSITVR